MSRWLLVTTLLCFVPLTAWAQTNASFEADVLGAYDTVPTRTSLEAQCGDVRDRLESAATNRSLTLYARHRAITLTSWYPDSRTRGFLADLLDDTNPEIRRMAVYTLGRSFGRQADALLVAQLAGVIERDTRLVAQWAVRALRWVDHEDAVRLLAALANDGEERLAVLARRAIRDHVTMTPAQ